jgi:soluble lytic murein transglycosylase-like protein
MADRMTRNLGLGIAAGALFLYWMTRAREAEAQEAAAMDLPIGFFEGLSPSRRLLAYVALEKAHAAGIPGPGFVYQLYIESRFDPQAVSPAMAAGLAQFIPQAGVDYGLITMPAAKKAAYYELLRHARDAGNPTGPIDAAMLADPTTRDNRFDPGPSMDAGILFMQRMHARYSGEAEPWSLALAAYNAGPGRIDRYLSGAARLPDETSAYVARIAPYYGEDPAWTGAPYG